VRTVGIVAHSAEGGGLCFLETCRIGGERLGALMHPPIVMSAVPLALSMDGWNRGKSSLIAPHLLAPQLRRGVDQVASAGADFYICPDNTAHVVLEEIWDTLPLPGLHIARVVVHEIRRRGWKRVGLLGTRWTMTGPVYRHALELYLLDRLVPDAAAQERIHGAILGELCSGVVRPETTEIFLRAIDDLRDRGADCVILGCTEIPLVVSDANASLPVLDSTRLLARYAVEAALRSQVLRSREGWLVIESDD
jgi:aspartate racemase